MSLMRITQIGGIVVVVGGGVGGALHATHVTHRRVPAKPPAQTVHTVTHRSSQTGSGAFRAHKASSPSTSGSVFRSGSGSASRLPTHGVGGEGGVAAFPYASGVPVARFSATSPVRPGQPVQFQNESYDTAPGVSITGFTWSGRQSSYETVGVHPVTLVARDSLGRISTPFTVEIVVTNPPPPQDTPVAYFVVTSPVSTGSPVSYTNESYDPGGQTLVNDIWTGRASTFSVPGTYPVSLRVVNASGVWSSTFTSDVVVARTEQNHQSQAASGSGSSSAPSGPPSATQEPPPTSTPVSVPRQEPQAPLPTWSATVSPNPASRGQIVTVTATASFAPDAGIPTLEVPAALTGSWGGISYSRANASGPLTEITPETFERTLTVPESGSFPAGVYQLDVVTPNGSTVDTSLTIRSAKTGPIALEEPIQSGE